MAIDFAPAARREARAQARTAMMPLRARIERETAKALLLDTGFKTAWVPRRLVRHDPGRDAWMIPYWLYVEKAL